MADRIRRIFIAVARMSTEPSHLITSRSVALTNERDVSMLARTETAYATSPVRAISASRAAIARTTPCCIAPARS